MSKRTAPVPSAPMPTLGTLQVVSAECRKLVSAHLLRRSAARFTNPHNRTSAAKKYSISIFKAIYTTLYNSNSLKMFVELFASLKYPLNYPRPGSARTSFLRRAGPKSASDPGKCWDVRVLAGAVPSARWCSWIILARLP